MQKHFPRCKSKEISTFMFIILLKKLQYVMTKILILFIHYCRTVQHTFTSKDLIYGATSPPYQQQTDVL